MKIKDLVEGAARGLAEAVDDSVALATTEDRNLLALSLAVQHKRIGGDAGYFYDERTVYPTVWVVLPTGQVAVPLPQSCTDDLEASCLTEETPVGGYDGHGRRVGNERLLAYANGQEDWVRAGGSHP